MGLFTNKKKLCPICGNPTPRLFPTEIEGQAICKECRNKIDLPDRAEDAMTLEQFRQYLADYEANAALWPKFRATLRQDFSLSAPLTLDEKNGFIRLKNGDCWVIEKKYLKSFRILEDDYLLYEAGQGTLNVYPSDIPQRARELAPLIADFRREREEYERRIQREDMHRRGRETDEERAERHRLDNLYRPRFDDPALMHEFRVVLTFDHPYWPSYENTLSAPTFSDSIPSVEDYLREYNEKADSLYALASALMRMLDPRAGETVVSGEAAPVAAAAATVPAASTDAVAEIKRFKELLDLGVITEEEFTAKKRQLMGL